MKALSGFLITGTQMKYERPGKATVVTPCTTIDGQYVQFKDGSAKRIQDEEEIIDGLPIDVDWPIERIWDLGEILIPFGEFLENNHQLLPSPYVREWHEQLTSTYPLNFSEALSQCREYQIPMAPEYGAMFNDLSAHELKKLYDGVRTSVCGNYIEIPKSLLELVYRLNIDVSIYMADARFLKLPLIGELDPEAHDWRNLFNRFDLWAVDQTLSKIMFGLGWAGIFLTWAWIYKNWRTHLKKG
jgi:hypothetical protein